MTSIQPELWVESPREALAFYEAAFGASVIHVWETVTTSSRNSVLGGGVLGGSGLADDEASQPARD